MLKFSWGRTGNMSDECNVFNFTLHATQNYTSCLLTVFVYKLYDHECQETYAYKTSEAQGLFDEVSGKRNVGFQKKKTTTTTTTNNNNNETPIPLCPDPKSNPR